MPRRKLNFGAFGNPVWHKATGKNGGIPAQISFNGKSGRVPREYFTTTLTGSEYDRIVQQGIDDYHINSISEFTIFLDIDWSSQSVDKALETAVRERLKTPPQSQLLHCALSFTATHRIKQGQRKVKCQVNVTVYEAKILEKPLAI